MLLWFYLVLIAQLYFTGTGGLPVWAVITLSVGLVVNAGSFVGVML